MKRECINSRHYRRACLIAVLRVAAIAECEDREVVGVSKKID